jgi:hypothetical protein
VTQVTDPPPLARDTENTGHDPIAAGPPRNFTEFPMFKSNVGGIDRMLRVVIGITLIALALTGTVGWWGWIGVVPLLTAALGSCPLYTVLGLSTCPHKAG